MNYKKITDEQKQLAQKVMEKMLECMDTIGVTLAYDYRNGQLFVHSNTLEGGDTSEAGSVSVNELNEIVEAGAVLNCDPIWFVDGAYTLKVKG